MRIDFHYGPQTVSETDRSNGRNSTTNFSASKTLAEDDSQVLGAHVQVQALAAQASNLTEVREDRVQSLRQAIQNGEYQTNPENVAGALFTHMASGFTRPNVS